MNKDIFIHSIRPVLPLHHLPQSETVDWILKSHERFSGTSLEKLRRFTLSEHSIKQRYFECDDIDENWDEHSVYKLTEESPLGAGIGKRNEIFAEKTQRVFHELYQDSTPDQLIHVTCTGYTSPSSPQRYFSQKNSSPGITHAYHMGCYASLPAVRMAMGLHLSSGKDVDVVHTELCSLHLNPDIHTPEQMVVQSLFADGHIKYSIGKSDRGLRILRVKEKLLPDSLSDMTWVPDSFGMQMSLSKEVPFKIRDALPQFIHELGGGRHDIYAIHPGGPKIIEAVQKKLELHDEQVVHSKKVLFERGNMSSATLPHVWHEILSGNPEKGRKVISLAFGPGLTIFGSVFEVH